MTRLLLKGISGQILGFNKEILIYFLESCVFFIIFKSVSSSTIYSNYYFYMIATFRPEILYTVGISPRKQCISYTCSIFVLWNDIHNLQKPLIPRKYNQKNKNNNIKLSSTSTEPHIPLQRVIRSQSKLNGKIRLWSFNLKYTSEYNPTNESILLYK